MDKIKLISPAIEHRSEVDEYVKEFSEWGETVAMLDKMDYGEWLEKTQNNGGSLTGKSGLKAAGTFFAFRESDSRLIGMLDIRYSLNNEFLAQYGGHIGCSVRPGERRKGYAVEMTRQALDYARQLGLSRVMLGCYSDNLASKRAIEKCGGRLTEVKPYLDGRMMNVYWIIL